MQRRQFLKRAVTGAAAGSALGAGALAQPGEQVRWRMATPWPAGPLLIRAPQMMAERVSELTNGNFEIRVYMGGEVVPALETLDAVQQGIVECGHGWGPYWIGKNRAFAIDGGIPFGLNSRQHYAWFYNAGGMDLLHELYRDFGVIGWPAGNCDYQMGGFFREEIHGVDDIRGLRFRIGGLGGEILSRMDVSTQVIAGGEIFSALERGAVDAAEWVGPFDDEQLGLHQVARYYYYPSWWEPGTPLSLYVNLGAWENLPPEYQAALETAAREVNLRHMAMYDYENTEALKRLADQGVELREFPREIMLRAEEISNDVYQEFSERDATWAEIFGHWSNFRDEVRESFETMAFSYANFFYSER